MDITLSRQKTFRVDWRKIALGLSFVALLLIIYNLWPVKNHWFGIFRPATLKLISGQSPYEIKAFFSPPWALIPIIPFAILPERLGAAIYSTVTLFGFGYAAHRMGAKPITILVFLTIPQVLYNTLQVNIDWMVALSFTLPPQIGLFFLLAKPQVGAFVALFWLVESARTGGIKEVARVFAPVTAAFALSFVFYGPWIVRSSALVAESGKHLWPWSIPFGIALVIYSVIKRDKGPAIISGPLLAPYSQPYTWPLAIMGVIRNERAVIVLAIVFWISTFWFRYLFADYLVMF